MGREAPFLSVRLRASASEEYRVVTDRVLSFSYQDRERKTDLCKLQVDNSDLSNFDDPVFKKGSLLVVSWGYVGNMAPAREVVITSVKGFKTLQIEAEAKSVLMNRVTRARTFEGQTVSQIARTLAQENGYGPDAQVIEDTDEVIDVVPQCRLTDAAFLRQRAARIGFEFYVDFDGFHFHPRRLGARPIRSFVYHTDPGQGDIIDEPTIDNDVTAKPGRVRAVGRDADGNEIDEAADNDSDPDRDALAEVLEMFDPETGRHLGRAVQGSGSIGSEETVSTTEPNAAAARQNARARFRRTQQTAVKMKIVIVGDPLLLAKTVVQVEGMGRRLSQRYYVSEIEHALAESGYRCTLSLVSDGHGGHSTVSRRAVGLSLLEVGRSGSGTGTGSGRSEDVERRLQEALDAANAAGDEASARSIRGALQAYRRDGNRAREQVTQALGGVARNPDADASVREASSGALGALRQREAEPANAGTINRQNAPEADSEALEPVDYIADPEAGTLTAFRPTRGRG